MFNEFRFNETLRTQVAGRIEQVAREGRGARSVRRSARQHRARPPLHAEERRHRLPAGSAAGTSSAASPRNMSSARRARRSCCRAACTRRPRPSTSAIPNLKIEAAKTVEIGHPPRRAGSSASRRPPTTRAIRRLHLPQPHRRDLRRRRSTPAPARRSSAPAATSTRRSIRSATRPSAAANSRASSTWRRSWGGTFGIETSTTSCARPSPTAPMCRASRRARRRRRVLARRATGSRASTCCTRSRRTTSRGERDADRRLQPAQGRARSTPRRCGRTISARATSRVGIVGNNLLNDDIRNHVSFKKDEVLMPGRGVRFFATLRN